MSINLLENIISQDFTEEEFETLKIKPTIRKPDPQKFFRTFLDSKSGKPFCFEINVIEDKKTKNYYFVHKNLQELLKKEFKRKRFYPAIDDENEIFFIPVSVNSSSFDKASISMHQAALEGINSWIRVQWGNSTYEITRAKSKVDQPDWGSFEPTEAFNEAIEDFYIESDDHPLVLRLMGA